MNITGVSPDPVPNGQTTTVTYTGGPAIKVLVTLNGAPVKVNAVINSSTVVVGPFPGAGGYQITLIDGLGGEASTGVVAQ